MSDTDMDMLNDFQAGVDALQDAAKSGAQFARTHFFGIEKDGGIEKLRFLTEASPQPIEIEGKTLMLGGIITVLQHQMVPTKDAPSDAKNWPKSMGAVCRYTKKADKVTPFFDNCYICDKMRKADGKKYANSARGWALAVLREEVIENGRRVGYRDQIREIQPTDDQGQPKGDPIKEPAVVVVNMAYKNFFSPLQGFAAHHGTLLDRDYIIRRKGTGTDTQYDIIPEDRIPDYDMRDVNLLRKYVPEDVKEDPRIYLHKRLIKEITDRMSDDFYNRFFNREVATPARSSDNGSSDASAPAKPTTEPDAESLAALKARVTGYGAQEGSAPQPQAEAAQPQGDNAQPAEATASSGGMKNFG